MRLVFLDTGTPGMVANLRGTPRAVQCQRWTRNLLVVGDLCGIIPRRCTAAGRQA